MSNDIWQVEFRIDGLIPPQVKLKRRLWLKKGEILLEKRSDSLRVHVFHEGGHTFNAEDKILPYFKFSPLLSTNRVHIEGGQAVALRSREEFGKDTKSYLYAQVHVGVPDDVVPRIEEYTPHFLRQIKKLHDKYVDVMNENRFLSLAMDFLLEATNKSIFSDEGFLCAVIGIEALFNEGPSDISYKIAHRAGFLVGLWTEDSIGTFKNLKLLYKNRNKLVHGQGSIDSLEGQKRWDVIRYATISIRIFLVLLKNSRRRSILDNKRKEEVLAEIDCAMLDPARREKLKQEIDRGMKSFDLDVPRTFTGKGAHGGYKITPW